jgi:hypothetical protein
MEKVALSGGPFGGEQFDLSKFKDNMLKLTDNGTVYLYSLSLSADSQEATFCGTE